MNNYKYIKGREKELSDLIILQSKEIEVLKLGFTKLKYKFKEFSLVKKDVLARPVLPNREAVITSVKPETNHPTLGGGTTLIRKPVFISKEVEGASSGDTKEQPTHLGISPINL